MSHPPSEARATSTVGDTSDVERIMRVGDLVRLEPRLAKRLRDKAEWWWRVVGFSEAGGLHVTYAREGGIVRRFDVAVSKVLDHRRI